MRAERDIEVWDQRQYEIVGYYDLQDELLGTHPRGKIGAYADEAQARAAITRWLDEHDEGRYDRLAMLYRIEAFERRPGKPPRRLGHGRGRLLAWWYFFGDRYDASATHTEEARPTRAQIRVRLAYQGQRDKETWAVHAFHAVAAVAGLTIFGAAAGSAATGFGFGLLVALFVGGVPALVSYLWARNAARKAGQEPLVTKTGPFIAVLDVRGDTWREGGSLPIGEWRSHGPDSKLGTHHLLFGDEKVTIDDEQGRSLVRLGPLDAATVTFFRSDDNPHRKVSTLVLEVHDGAGRPVYQNPRYVPKR